MGGACCGRLQCCGAHRWVKWGIYRRSSRVIHAAPCVSVRHVPCALVVAVINACPGAAHAKRMTGAHAEQGAVQSLAGQCCAAATEAMQYSSTPGALNITAGQPVNQLMTAQAQPGPSLLTIHNSWGNLRHRTNMIRWQEFKVHCHQLVAVMLSPNEHTSVGSMLIT